MIKNVLILYLFFLSASAVHAKEIKIVSDELEIVRADNISIFSGNVYAIEDDLEIWSEKLILISSNDETTIEEINAENNVTIIKQELVIEGRKAKYDPVKNYIKDIKTACLWKKKSSTFNPDYCSMKLDSDPWIVQPTEHYEELSIEKLVLKYK